MAKLNTKIVMLEGENGKDGTNIKSVEKSASDGLTDTYTITLTDGSKSSFNVTNGKGISSIEKASTSGLVDTYTITYNDGTTQNYTVNNGRGISSISKTGSTGVDDIYTITYNDETTSTFMVPSINGINLIQSQIVPTAAIEVGETASKAYSVGNFLVKNGILYKVTKAIAKDDTLTVGTNIATTTVGGELSERVQLSLDAVAVGKDEDGDTIYEKTFKGSEILGGTYVDHNLTKQKIKWIRLIGGCIKEKDGWCVMLPYYGLNSQPKIQYDFFADSDGLAVNFSRGTAIETYHFTVQYVLA